MSFDNPEVGNYPTVPPNETILYLMELISEATLLDKAGREAQYSAINELIQGHDRCEELLSEVVQMLEGQYPDQENLDGAEIAQYYDQNQINNGNVQREEHVTLPSMTFRQLHMALGRCGVVRAERTNSSKHFLMINERNGCTTRLGMHGDQLPSSYVGNVLKQLGISPQEFMEQK